MFNYYNLGLYSVEGTGLNRFSLPSIPKKQNEHLVSLLFFVSVSGIATGPISKKMFLEGICDVFNLDINNIRYVDNLNGESLDYLRTHFGNQFSSFVHPSVAGAGTFNVEMIYSVGFECPLLIDPYDFCMAVNDINNMSFEFKRGNLTEISQIDIRVLAKTIYREHEYLVPRLKIRRFSLSKQISDNVNIPNRVLYMFFQFPLTGSLDDTVILRSKRNVFCDNGKLKDLDFFFNPISVYSDLQSSDYNFLYVHLVPNRPMSIKKPLLYENENLFYNDLSVANSPFYVVSVEAEAGDLASNDTEFDSRFSPSKK